MTTTNKGLIQPANGSYVDTWDQPVNNDWSYIDAAFGGVTALNATGISAATLTLAQYQPMAIAVSGAMSNNVTYTIPSGVGGNWIVRNTTTDATGGPWTVTFASGGGGSTVTAVRSVNSNIWSDGTNMYFSDSRPASAGGTDTQVQYNSSGTLGASANLTFSGTQLNINQPASYASARVQVSSSTNSNIFAAEMPAGGPGTGFISVGNATTANYDHFGAYKIGSATRLFGVGSDGNIISASTIIAGSTIKSSSGGFVFPDNTTQTTAAAFPSQGSGYQYLPSGLLLQWGNATVEANSSATIGFNTTFPTSCYNIQLTQTLDYNYTGGPYALGVDTTTNPSNFTVWNNNSGLYGFFWFAIGR